MPGKAIPVPCEPDHQAPSKGWRAKSCRFGQVGGGAESDVDADLGAGTETEDVTDGGAQVGVGGGVDPGIVEGAPYPDGGIFGSVHAGFDVPVVDSDRKVGEYGERLPDVFGAGRHVGSPRAQAARSDVLAVLVAGAWAQRIRLSIRAGAG